MFEEGGDPALIPHITKGKKRKKNQSQQKQT
jgi:hypothetical protein